MIVAASSPVEGRGVGREVAVSLALLVGVGLAGHGASTWWGLDTLRGLGASRWLLLAALAVVAAVPGARAAAADALARAHAGLGRAAAPLFVLVVGVLAVTVTRPLVGDGPMLVDMIRGLDPVGIARPLTQALLVIIHRELRFVGVDDPVVAFRVLGVLSALGWAAGVVSLARSLADDAEGRRVVVLACLSTSAVLPLLGHVEVYALDTALLTWALALAARAVDLRGAALAALLLGLAGAAHGRMLFAAPLLVALSGRAGQGLRRFVPWAVWLSVLASVPVAWRLYGVPWASMSSLGFPGGGDATAFVPLWTPAPPSAPVTLLSLGHAADVVQVLLYAVPVALLAVVGGRAPDPLRRRPLLVAATGLAVVTLAWNPDFGARDDRDLLAVVAVALGPWAGAVLAQRAGRREVAVLLAGLVILRDLGGMTSVYR